MSMILDANRCPNNRQRPHLLLQDNLVGLDVAGILVVLVQYRDGGLGAALQEDHVDHIELVDAHVECLVQLPLVINWDDLHRALNSLMHFPIQPRLSVDSA